jgi:hypothetical protein
MPYPYNDTLEVHDSPQSNEPAFMLVPIDQPEHEHHEHSHDYIEVEDPESTSMEHSELHLSDPEELEIIVTELPGAPNGTKLPESKKHEEEVLEVKDEKEDSKPKKNEKWDWESRGPQGFVVWIKEKLDQVPGHSGVDTAGLQRACAYLEKVDDEISKAMRLDIDGELDANKIEEVRVKIDDGISRLQERLDHIKSVKKGPRKKKSEYLTDGLVKEAQKITGVQGVFVMVPLLISRIGRIIINGTVSAGHDSEDMFKKLSEKYKLTYREKEELMQYLADSGFPMRQDRGYAAEEALEVSDTDGMDWAANYHA